MAHSLLPTRARRIAVAAVAIAILGAAGAATAASVIAVSPATVPHAVDGSAPQPAMDPGSGPHHSSGGCGWHHWGG